MSRISAPLKESVLFSPRTANYVFSFIREGDKFDYYKWLQQVRGEAAQAKELPQPITSGNDGTARIDTPNSILDCRKASPNSTLFTRRVPIPGGMRRSYQESISRTSSARIGRRLEAICGAWDDFQASRARDAVYGYLGAVFAIVEHYKMRRRNKKLLRQAPKFADLPFDKTADPFTAVIRCTCDDSIDSKTISKWARALRYVAQFKDPSTRLKAFMTEAGGVNACADRYAKYFGRGGRCQSRRHSAPSPRWRFQQLSSPKWPARMRSNSPKRTHIIGRA